MKQLICMLLMAFLCLMSSCSGTKKSPDTEAISKSDSDYQETGAQSPVSDAETVTLYARSSFIEITPDMQIHSREEADLKLVLNIGEAKSDLPKTEETISVYCNGRLLWKYPFYQNASEKGGIYIIRDTSIVYPEEPEIKKNPVTFLMWSYTESETGVMWRYSSFDLDAQGNKHNEVNAQHLFTNEKIENNPSATQVLLDMVFLSPINQNILNGYVLLDNTGEELVYSTPERLIACKEVQYRFTER